jgi:hypothetical protein
MRRGYAINGRPPLLDNAAHELMHEVRVRAMVTTALNNRLVRVFRIGNDHVLGERSKRLGQ